MECGAGFDDRCGTQLPPGSKFCLECGRATEVVRAAMQGLEAAEFVYEIAIHLELGCAFKRPLTQ